MIVRFIMSALLTLACIGTVPGFAQYYGYRPCFVYYIDEGPDPDAEHRILKAPDWELWGSVLDNQITELVNSKFDKVALSIGRIPRSCKFEFIITKNQKIERIRILKSSMSDKFDELVIDAIKSMQDTTMISFPPNSRRKSILMKTWVHCQGKSNCKGDSWKDLVNGDCSFYIHKESGKDLSNEMKAEKEIHNRATKIRTEKRVESLAEVPKPVEDAAPIHDTLLDWQFQNPVEDRDSKRIWDPLGVDTANKPEHALWTKSPPEIARRIYSIDKKFEENLWRSSPEKWRLRPYMFGAFASEYGLIGMSKAKLHELLGFPDCNWVDENPDPHMTNTVWYKLYFGGQYTSIFSRLCAVYLEIAFDDEQKVSAYRVMVRITSGDHLYRSLPSD